ncbi:hypothetical protein QBC35DRAFT_486302 [Podospora australis]|uniref:Secreted protein n=1 Tax=Podospora australis TaxID=1536484 RepID=A0AAN7AM91_9PEZI|nr:hypothetical protein QBC35DRAFT_486302 [Podospora australis]
MHDCARSFRVFCQLLFFLRHLTTWEAFFGRNQEHTHNTHKRERNPVACCGHGDTKTNPCLLPGIATEQPDLNPVSNRIPSVPTGKKDHLLLLLLIRLSYVRAYGGVPNMA